MSFSQRNVSDLLDGARRLDRNALGAIHDHYYPLIYRYVYFRVGERELSAQITSQVFEHLLRNLSGKRSPKQNLDRWIFRQAALLVDGHLQDPSKEVAPSLVASAVQRSNGSQVQDELPENLQQIKSFQQAVSGLKLEEQHYIALRFTVTRSLGDVANLLGEPVRKLRKLQFRILSSLGRVLSELS